MVLIYGLDIRVFLDLGCAGLLHCRIWRLISGSYWKK